MRGARVGARARARVRACVRARVCVRVRVRLRVNVRACVRVRTAPRGTRRPAEACTGATLSAGSDSKAVSPSVFSRWGAWSKVVAPSLKSLISGPGVMGPHDGTGTCEPLGLIVLAQGYLVGARDDPLIFAATWVRSDAVHPFVLEDVFLYRKLWFESA